MAPDPAAVLFATAEDSLGATIVPRLEAVGADLDLVGFVQVRRDGIGAVSNCRTTWRRSRGLVRERNVRLLVIDPLVTHLART